MKPQKLILGLIPNNKCNLKCSYCYISQLPPRDIKGKDFTYTAEHMARCLSPERLGGTCLINLTGQGETMLQSNIVELCGLLLEKGHYVELVTNLTITRIVDKFMELPVDLLRRLEFKISFHYKELKRLNLLDNFWKNVMKVQGSESSFTLELMPYDELIPDIDEIIVMCYENVGAKCQVTVGRADYLSSRSILTEKKYEDYKKCWEIFESPMFDFKMNLLDNKRREFCYAGAWTLFVDMYTGEASPCYAQPYRQNIFKDYTKPIKFIAVGYHCMEPYCINGHAHIAMGVIPSINAPTYEVIRNRTRDDGTEWFSDEAKDFFATKLYNNNKEYNSIEKIINSILWYKACIYFSIKNPDKFLRKVKAIFKR